MWGEVFAGAVLGAMITFALGRLVEWNRKKSNRLCLLSNLREELKEIRMHAKEGRIAQGRLLYPELWDSVVASGEIRLLDLEKTMKLARVYTYIKGTAYEAQRRRDRIEQLNLKGIDGKTEEGFLRSYDETLEKRQKILLASLESLLAEKWWEKVPYIVNLAQDKRFLKICASCNAEIPLASEECPFCKAKSD
jgi:ribosomal protein L40E